MLARAQIPGSSVPTIAASLTVLMIADAVVGASLIAALWVTGVLPELPSVPAPGFVPVAAAVRRTRRSLSDCAPISRRRQAGLQAFRIDAGLGTALLVVVLSGLSTAVPVPGGAGSQQILAT
jgi:hypothetical protein